MIKIKKTTNTDAYAVLGINASNTKETNIYLAPKIIRNDRRISYFGHAFDKKGKLIRCEARFE